VFYKDELDPNTLEKNNKYKQDFSVELYFEDVCDKCNTEVPLESYCPKCTEYTKIEVKNWMEMMNILKVKKECNKNRHIHIQNQRMNY
jgi:hypothetical protein